MRMPKIPPKLQGLLADAVQKPGLLEKLGLTLASPTGERAYSHWDELLRLPAPEGIAHSQWWLALKLARRAASQPIALTDGQGRPFVFTVPVSVQEALHAIDTGSGGLTSVPEAVTNPQTRDRYLVSSMIEEAISSSQLEGAATTREVAKEMIRTGRKPRDRSERMILNNYRTMQRIRELKDEPLTAGLVFEIHRLVTQDTLRTSAAAGRFRRSDERVMVHDMEGHVMQNPPRAEELPTRLEAMCAFANATTPDFFVHPVVRAIILHFWLAYDHPFVDGNGRTARALFYWAMSHRGYWLFEYLSVSSILRKAPTQYALSFLHTETDDNDLTYFLIAQAKVILAAVESLHAYIKRKTDEAREAESGMRALDRFNHRQAAILRHAVRHPGQAYTIAGHRLSHNVVYQTARTDLLELRDRGLMTMRKRGKQLVFTPVEHLVERLKDLGMMNQE
ncbi:MAG: Fic family protein [Candidatus Sumerlaeia bacterium]|nr:Fic family protein [Candidatus Sumerlaeia bacterium]